VTNNFSRLVERCNLDSWKQVLAILITYLDRVELSSLAGTYFDINLYLNVQLLISRLIADKLSQRLQGSKDEGQKLGALLCCICSGNLDHLVNVWVGDQNQSREDSPEELQVRYLL